MVNRIGNIAFGVCMLFGAVVFISAGGLALMQPDMQFTPTERYWLMRLILVWMLGSGISLYMTQVTPRRR